MDEIRSARLTHPLRRPSPVERVRDALLLAWVLLGAWAAFVAFRGYVFEDAYITYRYAANLAGGHGFAFNPGEAPLLGTTTPGWTLLLALASTCGFDIPTAGAFLSAVFVAASGLCGAVLLRRLGHPNLGVVYALALVSGVFGLHLLSGMETALACFLVHAAALALLSERPVALGLTLGLACLARHDGVVLAGVALALAAYAGRRPPWTSALVAAGVILPWLLYAWSTFGTLLPNTFGAKADEVSALEYVRASVPLLLERLFVPQLFEALPISRAACLGLTACACLPLVCLVAPVRAEPRRALLLLHPLLLWAGYAVIGPLAGFWWHVVPAACLALLCALWGLGEALERLGLRSRRSACGLAVVLLGVGLVRLPGALARQACAARADPPYRLRAESYQELARWFVARGWTDLLVLIHEPGYFAWLTGCRVVDSNGLVTAGVFRDGPTKERKSVAELVAQFHPDVVVANGCPEGFVSLRTFPRQIAVRADVLRARVDSVEACEPWDGGEATLALDFERGDEAGFYGARPCLASAASLGLPLEGDVLTTHPAVTGRPLCVLVGPPMRVDFDELDFDLVAHGAGRMLRVHLMIDGAPVLTHEVRAEQPVRVRWPVGAWRGRTAALVLEDLDREGWMALDHVRSLRHEGLTPLDDFAGGAWSQDWRTDFGPAPVAGREVVARLGPRFLVGPGTALSWVSAGEHELVRTLHVENDTLSGLVLDLGGPSTRVELRVAGTVVRCFVGGHRPRLQPLVWDLRPWRGRDAELRVFDGAPSAARAIGLAALVLFDEPEAR